MFRSFLSLPRTVYLLCLGTFINRAGTFVVVFLTLYLTDRLHLDPRFATHTMGWFGLGAVLAAGLGGHLADSLGRRKVMLLALFGGAGLLVWLSLIRTPWLIQVAVVLFGLVSEMYRPAASAMIADVTEASIRPRAFGLMYVSINLGFAVGSYVGGELAARDYRLLFYCDAGTSVAYGLLILLLIRETLALRQVQPGPATPIAGAGSLPPAGTWETARHILTNGPFLLFLLGNFFIALVFMQSMSTFPLFLKERGFAQNDYGKIIAVNGLLIVLLQVPATMLLGRFHRGSVMVGGALLNALGFGMKAFVTSFGAFVAAVVVWTLGEIMLAPFAPAIVSDFAPSTMRARYMGVYGVSFSAAMMIAAPLGGEILTDARFGAKWLWIAAAAACTLSALLYGSVRRHLAVRPA